MSSQRSADPLAHGQSEPGQRRRTTLSERLDPCSCCGYPLSQRHHGLPVAIYGESDPGTALCANCHELVHIVEQAGYARDGLIVQSKRTLYLYDHFVETFGENDPRLVRMRGYLNLVRSRRSDASFARRDRHGN